MIEVAPAASKPKVGAKSGPTPAMPPARPSPPGGERAPLPLPADAKPLEPPGRPSASAPIPRLPAVIIEDQVLETVPEAGPDLAARGRGADASRAPDASRGPDATGRSKLIVPIGEFDDGAATIDEDRLRVAMAQATIKRDAANALLGIPEPPSTVVKGPPVELLLAETATALRGEPTEAGSTSRFERGDPTTSDSERGDATAVSQPAEASAVGTLRNAATLRRKRGIGGDVRYVATVLAGVRRARRELEQLEKREATLQTSHRHHLITLGRTAVTTEALHHPGLGRAREQLAAVEDERSQHAGQVAAADAELLRVKRDRETKAKQHVADLAAIDSELVELAKKVEPLEKEAAAARKHAAELREALTRIERQIADTEAKLVSVRGQKLERSEILAEIASLKADRLSVKRDEPKLAGELDALNPRLAAVEAARVEAHRRRDELAKAEVEDKRRVEELLTAIGAKRKVVERAVGDAEAARDKTLFELGERLYVDRSDVLVAQLAPIDEIDLDLGEADRRIMELREILSSVDKAKLARGILLIVAVAATLSALIAWIIVNLMSS